MKRISIVLPFFISLSISFWLFSGCASTRGTKTVLTPEERFALAKAKFDKHDYLEAIDELSVITLQYAGSTIADSAQLLLGEARYARGEYLLAAYEFEKLIRNMPSSSLVPYARYRLGMCYYELSPKPELDQTYTYKAIDELQTFVEYYPTNELVPEAERRIHELNNKLALKNLKIAELYMKMEDYKAALIYFDHILERYHDSDVADRAAKGKIEALIARRQYDAARQEVQHFRERYPTSSLLPEVDKLNAQIDRELLQRNSAPSGQSAIKANPLDKSFSPANDERP